MNASRNRCLYLTGWLVLVLLAAGCSQSRHQPAGLYQVSTLQALMQGAYDGVVPFEDLVRHGDTGIGTFHALDGEMILLDGQAWQARADGRVLAVPAKQTTPFATVAFLRPARQVPIESNVNMAGLAESLDRQLPTPNLFYLVRIDGRFAHVKTRSVPAQKPPYPPLLEVSRQQSVFERRDVRGTLIGLRCPSYVQGINMAGWHMHFLADDRTFGGHVLDLRFESGQARIAELRRFEMVLPSRGRFVEADLSKNSVQDIHKVEQ